MYADELLLPWFCSLVEGRAVVFPLMERAGYREANDAVLAAAAASDGRLVPFCRVDPHADPVGELERCVAAGARGVKLHPRAERFDLRHPGVAAVFGFAAERRLPVTINSGLGIPSLGRDALMLGERYPQAPLILAHVGVTDLAWIWRGLGEHPSVFFDTAWWNPADHLALFALVPPSRILLGSDAPYGTPAAAAIVAIRCGLQVGLTATQIEAVAGGQLERLLAGDDPLDLGPAPGPTQTRPPLLDRVFVLLVGALARMLEGTPADGLVQLAWLRPHRWTAAVLPASTWCWPPPPSPRPRMRRCPQRLPPRHGRPRQVAATGRTSSYWTARVKARAQQPVRGGRSSGVPVRLTNSWAKAAKR